MTPLDGSSRGVGFEAPGFQPGSELDKNISLNTVSEDYFRTLGTPLLYGRDFTQNDHLGAPHVALLNESARRHFFNGREAVGTVMSFGPGVIRPHPPTPLRALADGLLPT